MKLNQGANYHGPKKDKDHDEEHEEEHSEDETPEE